MRARFKVAGVALYVLLMIVVYATLLHGHTIAVLQPKGPIARQEMDLMITATLLMLIVVIPVFALTIGIAWKYRASNTKAKYTPDWDRNPVLETIWWGLPCLIIVMLSVIAWNSSHTLDPYKPLVSKNPQMTIQVVAMDWKWLFIYPQQNIATVNYVEFPNATPVDFEITSDAPMNSFWIPQLGGQIYAMPGMATQVHLMADGSGVYNGSSANISGIGFSGMTFLAKSTTSASFNSWVNTVRKSPNSLDPNEYTALAKPSEYNKPSYYSSVVSGLYDDVIMKYMMPASQTSVAGAEPATGSTSKSTSMQGMVMQ